jgi:hypothetical protein
MSGDTECCSADEEVLLATRITEDPKTDTQLDTYVAGRLLDMIPLARRARPQISGAREDVQARAQARANEWQEQKSSDGYQTACWDQRHPSQSWPDSKWESGHGSKWWEQNEKSKYWEWNGQNASTWDAWNTPPTNADRTSTMPRHMSMPGLARRPPMLSQWHGPETSNDDLDVCIQLNITMSVKRRMTINEVVEKALHACSDVCQEERPLKLARCRTRGGSMNDPYDGSLSWNSDTRRSLYVNFGSA